MKTSKFKIIGLLLLILPMVLSCDEFQFLTIDCSQCYINKPLWGEIELKLTINEENQEVKVSVYNEKYDESRLVSTDLYYWNRVYIPINTDQTYVFKAEYTHNGRAYHVINKGKLKTRLDYDNCDEACYYIIEQSVNLQIKE